MRKDLQKINGDRQTFTGTFSRFGQKSGYKGPLPTLLLLNVKNQQGKTVTDHLWFNLTKGFAALELEEGDLVQFDARVKEYEKGYKGWDFEKQLESPIEIDYKLSHPTKLSVLKRAEKEESQS